MNDRETTGRQPRGASGYSSWRLIAEEIRAQVADGAFPEGRLPAEGILAERFGVNRHTVRQAIAALAAEGLVESRRGSGTYVVGETVHHHRIGLRTRFSKSFGTLPESAGRVLGSVLEEAPDDVREKLGIVRALHVETVRQMGGRPITYATHWFDPDRLPGIEVALRRTGSVTASLRSLGVDDYVRASTTVSARHATADEAAHLGLGPGAIVLVTRGFDTLPDGAPLQVIVTRFDAARIALDIEHS